MSGRVTWTPERTELLRTAWANGKTRAECAKLTGATPKAIKFKVSSLGIAGPRGFTRWRPGAPTLVPALPSEPNIPHFVHHQAVTDYRGGWNYREQCFDNNHLYREPVSLAAVW